MSGPASARTAAQLSSASGDQRYAPLTGARLGNDFVFWGDSLTQSGDQPLNNLHGGCWPVYAAILSNQQIRYVWNAGIAGNLTRQMIARFQTDVAPYKPASVTIMGGTNDFLSGYGVAEPIANLTTMVAFVRSIRAVPVLCTIPPNTTVTGMNAKIDKLNYWIARYAADQGIAVLDFHSVLTDPSTNTYKSTYVADGTHPNQAGYVAMANHAVSILTPLLPSTQTMVPTRYFEDNNLLYDGCFSADTNSDGIDDSLQHIAATGVTCSLAAATVGKWQTVAASASTGGSDVLFQNLTAPVAGHRYRLVGKVQSSTWTAGSYKAYLRFTGAIDLVAVGSFTVPVTGTFVVEGYAPANATGMSARFEVATGSTGTVQWGQVGVYDLTALGLT